MEKKIFLMRPNVGEKELELVKQVIASGQLVEGKMVREFENTVSVYIDVKHALACTSATTGLELCLRALNIGPGDEVLVPDFTHPATALAVMTLGANPVFVDVDIETYNTTAEILKKGITKNTKAIIPVSIFGNPLDIDPIMELGKKNNIPVIEDAACSLGSEYKSRKTGLTADMTVFSFHPRKIFATGDGGLIVTNNTEYYNLMLSMKKFGNGISEGVNTFVRWGTNYRMSDILGAIALGQVRRIDEIISLRIKKAINYNELLEGVEQVIIPKIEKSSTSNYQTYSIFIKNDKRNYILKEMRDRNIEVQIGTFSLQSLPVFKNVKKIGALENSFSLSQNLLALPLHTELIDEEQNYIIKNLKELL